MNYVIIAENDESQWDDKTGESYNYPAKYKNLLKPNTRAIYYKGRLRNKAFASKRLSSDPHYFGVAIIGESYQDLEAEKKEFYCDILKYSPFERAVPFKVDGDYVEVIPESKKK